MNQMSETAISKPAIPISGRLTSYLLNLATDLDAVAALRSEGTLARIAMQKAGLNSDQQALLEHRDQHAIRAAVRSEQIEQGGDTLRWTADAICIIEMVSLAKND